MKSFKSYIIENSANARGNGSQNISYKGDGQQAVANPGQSGTNFGTNRAVKTTSGGDWGIDVKEWEEEEEENKPWQIRTADIAITRHAELLKWLSAVDPNHASSIPELPDWQTPTKKKS